MRLSLNGRDWGGAYTRPWVLVGRGTGAAVAVAYASQHKGRVAGLVLWDYDPEFPKDRVNFYPYQAAHFQNQGALAAFFNEQFGLQDKHNEDSGKYLAILFINRAHAMDIMEDAKGCEFNMDPHFFVADYNPGIGTSALACGPALVRLS